MSNPAPMTDARVCARCRKVLDSGEPVECFTPSWCVNWPGTPPMTTDASAVRPICYCGDALSLHEATGDRGCLVAGCECTYFALDEEFTEACNGKR